MGIFDIRCIVHGHPAFILVFGRHWKFSPKDSRQMVREVNFIFFGKRRDFRRDDLICSAVWGVGLGDAEGLPYPHELNCRPAEVPRVMNSIKCGWNQHRKKKEEISKSTDNQSNQ
jgi:hypothetical protein